MMCGAAFPSIFANPEDAAIQPACRPITSKTKTFVDDSAIDATSNPDSKVEMATNFATEPNPGQQSVTGKSLSTVLGIPMQVTGKPISKLNCDTLCAVS